MKPRNKRELYILECSKKLKPINKHQKKKAFNSVFTYSAVLKRKRKSDHKTIKCYHCGSIHDVEEGNTNADSDGSFSYTGLIPETEDITYVVQRGDYLSKIANKYGKTWQELASYNNIKNPSIIYIGQKIKIPK